MYQTLIIFHLLIGIGVIGLVMMQHGRGADAGAAFGAGASGTVFGARGAASFLTRATAILATLFFINSLALATLTGKEDSTQDLMDVPAVQRPEADLPPVSQEEGESEAVSDLPAADIGGGESKQSAHADDIPLTQQESSEKETAPAEAPAP